MLASTGERLLPWDLQYPSNHYEHLQRYYFAAQFAAGRAVLDLGSGEGYGADILASVASEATGVDISQEAVEWARQKYRRPNLTYTCGSATDIPISGESIFDLVVCFEMIEHILDQQALFREVRRLLKPSGLLIISTPNKTVYTDEPQYHNPFHLRELYVPDFRRLVESFFPYASYMGQRVHPAAAMWPMEAGAARADEIIVENTRQGFVRVEPARKSPMYVVAIASQQPFAEEIHKKVSSYCFLLDISDALVKRMYEDAQKRYDEGRAEVRKLSDALAERDARVASLTQALAERDARVASLTQALAERDARVASLTQTLADLENTISALLQSRSWKLTQPLRFISRSLGGSMTNLRRWLRLPREWWIVRKSRLFDTGYYLEQNLDVAKAGVNPLYHYLRRGVIERRDPHPLFDTSYYLEQYPDVAKAAVNPLAHYLVHGAREGRDPHPLFDSSYYLERYPDVAKAGVNPLFHYFSQGAAEGRDPHPLFDTSYYLEQYPDVAKAAVNPLAHYLAHGAREGRDPHPLFDSSYYLEKYPDVAEAGVNPLAHYLARGVTEGRDPNLYFDTSFYLEQNPDVAASGINPLLHYLAGGFREDREPSLLFSGKVYLKLNPDVADAEINPLNHFLSRGLADGRRFRGSTENLPFPTDTVSRAKQLLPPPGNGSDSLLIFDCAVPTPDIDSGSARMYSLVRLLRAIGHAVTFVADRDLGLPRYERMLQDMGVGVLCGFEAATAHLRAFGSRYRVVVLSRPDVCARYIACVRAFAVNAQVVYDTVDLHFLRFERAANLSADAECARLAVEYRKIEGLNITCADLVLAITQEEKRRILTNWPSVRVGIVPNVHCVRVQARPCSERRNLMFLGAYEHAPNVDAVTWFVREVFPIILRELPEVRFLIVGSKAPDSLKALVSPNVELVGWLPNVDPCFEQSKVFVAPLRYGAGMKGKIGQAMSVGLPVVTTSIGAEGMLLTDGVHALVADRPHDFARAVVRLYKDPIFWGEIQRQAASHVQKNFSESAVRELLSTLFPLRDSETPRTLAASAGTEVKCHAD